MSKKSFVMYSNWAEMLAEMPAEQAGILIKAISCYSLGKDFAIDDPVISAVFTMIRSKLDEDRSKYDEKVERVTKMNESKRNRDEIDTKSKRNRDDIVGVTDTVTVTVNDNVNDTDTDNGIPLSGNTNTPPCPPKAGKRFVPPTAGEVKAYCEENDYAVDPDEFVDFYTSKGWMIGKNHMKDWRAAVRTWVRGNRASPREKPKEDVDDYLLRRIRELEAEEASQ